MPQVFAYACDDKTSVFHRTTIEIREPADNEIYFDIQYAGICHSDIHTARGSALSSGSWSRARGRCQEGWRQGY